MTTIEAKNKICPINKENCIVEQCPKWEFTKTNKTYTYAPKAICRCGEMTMEYKLCFECGEVATPNRVMPYHTKVTNLGKLPYEEQEGKCTL